MKSKSKKIEKIIDETKSPVIEEPEPQSDMVKFEEKLNTLTEKFDNALDARELENLELQEKILRLEQSIAEREDDGEYVERDVDILHDPYDDKNAFKILAHIPGDDESPEGWVLGWKFPKYREIRGMRGWIPMEHGDSYCGENDELLSNYLNDPPERMQGPDTIDNCVRRGDVILCRIKRIYWEARQQKRTRDAKRDSIKAGSAKGEILRDGVEIVGTGLKDDTANRKRFGVRPAREGITEGRTTHPVLADPHED